MEESVNKLLTSRRHTPRPPFDQEGEAAPKAFPDREGGTAAGRDGKCSLHPVPNRIKHTPHL